MSSKLNYIATGKILKPDIGWRAQINYINQKYYLANSTISRNRLIDVIRKFKMFVDNHHRFYEHRRSIILDWCELKILLIKQELSHINFVLQLMEAEYTGKLDASNFKLYDYKYLNELCKGLEWYYELLNNEKYEIPLSKGYKYSRKEKKYA